MKINFSKNPRIDIYDNIMKISNELFSAVKNAPINIRAGLPPILRDNNFDFSLLVTKNHAFLEVFNKIEVHKDTGQERIISYQQLFVPLTAPVKICIPIHKARMCRISTLGLEGGHAFAIGNDFSLCISEVISLYIENEKPVKNKIDLMYVVGFGEELREEDAWQEFDALIRLSLADWSIN